MRLALTALILLTASHSVTAQQLNEFDAEFSYRVGVCQAIGPVRGLHCFEALRVILLDIRENAAVARRMSRARALHISMQQLPRWFIRQDAAMARILGRLEIWDWRYGPPSR